MKILYVATVRSHIGQFHMPVIRRLKEEGHEVHAAFKDNSFDKPGLDLSVIDKTFDVPFERSPYSKRNIKAYRVLKRIIENEDYDIIHCHTPVGSVITRVAVKRAVNKNPKVFYTAHGFHFYKGASLRNWILFYPLEKYLSRYTDVLITINDEDYNLAINRNFKAKKIVRVNGVGVDLSKFHVATTEEKKAVREELNIPASQFVLLYAADLSKRKNQTMIFHSLARLKNDYKNIKVLMPGQPILLNKYEEECKKLGITELVDFMGYRRDIDQLLTACDCVISSSRQEGLPLNLIEAAASGKYIIATDVRGNADVVKQSGFGTLVPLNDSEAMAKAIKSRINSNNINEYAKESVYLFSDDEIISTILSLYGNN